MAKNPIKIVKLEGLVKEKGYLYYLMNFPDGVYVCKSKATRHGKEA